MNANVVQKLDGFGNAVVRMLYKQIQLVIKDWQILVTNNWNTDYGDIESSG